MKATLQKIKEEAIKDIKNAKSTSELDDVRVKYLGKKGSLTSVLRGMGKLSSVERPIVGKLGNEIRASIEDNLSSALESLKEKEKELKIKSETVDISMPGRAVERGSKHPLTSVLDEVKDIFTGLGFKIVEGPEVELDHYNFEMMNIPKNHPARDVQDTFYINDEVVLRTHTSPMQARYMEKNKPPIRILVPGRVYRSDTPDASHSPVFNQIEGLVVDKGITMGDLKGTLDIFAKRLFGEDTNTKFRPHHFNFTEPSAEVDVSCSICKGKGCPVCKGTGWIEILGCGMVHVKVLENCGIDPKEYSGFAFGVGLDRIALIKYGINDIRLFYENDVRFLKQF
jgi:phenylalanyl-tRNA synthetase alpha chain